MLSSDWYDLTHYYMSCRHRHSFKTLTCLKKLNEVSFLLNTTLTPVLDYGEMKIISCPLYLGHSCLDRWVTSAEVHKLTFTVWSKEAVATRAWAPIRPQCRSVIGREWRDMMWRGSGAWLTSSCTTLKHSEQSKWVRDPSGTSQSHRWRADLTRRVWIL